jgi:hypothetical protein
MAQDRTVVATGADTGFEPALAIAAFAALAFL